MSIEQTPSNTRPSPGRDGIATAGFVLALLTLILFWYNRNRFQVEGLEVPCFLWGGYILWYGPILWSVGINFILWVLSLVLSAIGYGRAKDPGSPGRGLAISGLAITLGGMILLILFNVEVYTN